MKKILAIVLVIVVAFVGFSFLSKYYVYKSPYPRWYNDGLGRLIPSPYKVTGLIGKPDDPFRKNGTTYFHEYVYGFSKDDFEKYVDAVMDCGFKRDFYRSERWFHAKNDNPLTRRTVNISLFDNDSDSIYKIMIGIRIS